MADENLSGEALPLGPFDLLDFALVGGVYKLAAKETEKVLLRNALKGEITKTAKEAPRIFYDKKTPLPEYIKSITESVEEGGAKVKDIVFKTEDGGYVKVQTSSAKEGWLPFDVNAKDIVKGLGTVAFLDFILEEAGQQFGIATKIALDTKDTKRAEDALNTHEQFLNSLPVRLGALVPVFSSFFDAQRQILESNRKALENLKATGTVSGEAPFPTLEERISDAEKIQQAKDAQFNKDKIPSAQEEQTGKTDLSNMTQHLKERGYDISDPVSRERYIKKFPSEADALRLEVPTNETLPSKADAEGAALIAKANESGAAPSGSGLMLSNADALKASAGGTYQMTPEQRQAYEELLKKQGKNIP